MQNDEVIWQVIRHNNNCSFMVKIPTGIFCRNPYNVTGICNRSSCPLANSRYATIRDHDERAHKPDELWEREKLPRNYEKALEIVDKHLMYWPKFLVHKTKQRLTKMTQMQIRMRKLALKMSEKIMTTPRKEMNREARREEKAEKAAVLDKEPEVEYVEGYDELEEEEDMEDFGGLAIDETLKGDDYGAMDEYDEDMDTVQQKRARTGLGSAKLGYKIEKEGKGTC
ncbi:protein MAK16 homolog isoform X2 [Macadamia integrifolia]|uniref:protein MAK16 homolog isoform X2 n=1 Tax=Macadamia integrifolia TaxID=60698 RepID=UPI001C4F45D6|nr:protein MAK16 homolog isoform X2 [Macadamia integrifolia]